MGLPEGAYYVPTFAWSLSNADVLEGLRGPAYVQYYIMVIGRVTALGRQHGDDDVKWVVRIHDTDTAAHEWVVEQTEGAERLGCTLSMTPRDAVVDNTYEDDLIARGFYHDTDVVLDDVFAHHIRNGGFIEPGMGVAL